MYPPTKCSKCDQPFEAFKDLLEANDDRLKLAKLNASLEAENARYVNALTIIANFRFRNVFSNADIFRQAEIALAALKK